MIKISPCDRYKFIRKRASLKRKYGLSIEDYEKMFKNQEGKCGICGVEFLDHRKVGWGGNKVPCVDHNHETGKVRGILCRRCNLTLTVIEKTNFFVNANQYLSKSENISNKESI